MDKQAESETRKDDIVIRVHESGPPEGKTVGERSPDGKCPKCGAKAMSGFGLMGGGYGPYEVCEDFCGWYWKRMMAHDEE